MTALAVFASYQTTAGGTAHIKSLRKIQSNGKKMHVRDQARSEGFLRHLFPLRRKLDQTTGWHSMHTIELLEHPSMSRTCGKTVLCIQQGNAVQYEVCYPLAISYARDAEFSAPSEDPSALYALLCCNTSSRDVLIPVRYPQRTCNCSSPITSASPCDLAMHSRPSVAVITAGVDITHF